MMDDKYDLIVVGGGIAGLATAYFYLEAYPGSSVLVLERHGGHIGAGLSGRSGGHRMPGFEADFSELEKLLGKQDAEQLYLETVKTSELTDRIIQENSIVCGARKGYWIVDESITEFRKLDEFMAPRQSLGLPEPHFYRGDRFKQKIGFEGYTAGLYFPDIASFDTPKFLYGLEDAIKRRGGTIALGYEYSSHTNLKHAKKYNYGVILANGQQLQANRVVLAGGDVLSRQVPFLHNRTVTVYTGRIGLRLDTEDVARISPTLAPIAGCDTDLKSNQNPLEGDFLWFSLRSDGYLAMGFGGCFGSTNPTTTKENLHKMIEDVRRELYERAPFLKGKYRIKPTIGGLNTSSNLLPIVGALSSEERVHFIAAQSGVGLNQSILIAKSLVDSMKGDRRVYDMLLKFHDTQVLIPTQPRLRRAAVEIGILEKSAGLAAVRGLCHVAHSAAQAYSNLVRPVLV